MAKEVDMKEWELISYNIWDFYYPIGMHTTKMLSSDCPYVGIHYSKGVRKEMCEHNKNYRKRKDCSYVNCPIKKEELK
mgnify:CR=1 FL=1